MNRRSEWKNSSGITLSGREEKNIKNDIAHIANNNLELTFEKYLSLWNQMFTLTIDTAHSATRIHKWTEKYIKWDVEWEN